MLVSEARQCGDGPAPEVPVHGQGAHLSVSTVASILGRALAARWPRARSAARRLRGAPSPSGRVAGSTAAGARAERTGSDRPHDLCPRRVDGQGVPRRLSGVEVHGRARLLAGHRRQRQTLPDRPYSERCRSRCAPSRSTAAASSWPGSRTPARNSASCCTSAASQARQPLRPDRVLEPLRRAPDRRRCRPRGHCRQPEVGIFQSALLGSINPVLTHIKRPTSTLSPWRPPDPSVPKVLNRYTNSVFQ